ncbi:MAG: hypothetical protein HGA31_02895 [Candidatus Moranbacteria bacterium]|nr:hypothetical protein [Candidatus Moranbacteria bacterium]
MSGKGSKADTKGAARKPIVPKKVVPEKKVPEKSMKGPGYRILAIGTGGNNLFLIPPKKKGRKEQ